jgi:hypothetical protein
VHFVEQKFGYDFMKSRIAVRDRFVEPRERLVRIAAEGINIHDVVCPILFVVLDFIRDCFVAVALPPECAVGVRCAAKT